MAQNNLWFTVNLQSTTQMQVVHGSFFTADNLGAVIGAHVMDGNAPAELSGTVFGYIIRSDGDTVEVTGNLNDNDVSIALPESAVAVPGPVQVTIRLKSGDVKTVLLALTGFVQRSATGTIIDPGHVIPSVEDVIAKLDEMDAKIAETDSAIDAAEAAAVSANNATKYIAETEATSTAAAAHAKGSNLIYNGKLYQATADIAIGDTLATSGTGANIAEIPGGVSGQVADLKSAIVDVDKKIGGESENLHDLNTDVVGKYWGDNFTEETGSNYRHTALIDIGEYDSILVTNNSPSSSGKYCYFVSEDQTQYSRYSMGAMSGTLPRPIWAKYVTLSAGKNNTSLAVYGVYTGIINEQITNIKESDIPKINELADGYKLITELSDFQIGTYTRSNSSIHTSTTVACSTGNIIFNDDAVLIADVGYTMDVKPSNDSGVTYLWYDETCAYYVKKGQYVKLNVKNIPPATITDATAIASHVKVYSASNPTSPYAFNMGTFFGIEMYNTIGFVGDSYTAKRSTYNNCWADILCKTKGISGTIYAHSGYNTRRYRANMLQTVIQDTAKEFYWLWLGINDASTVKSTPEYLGSESDLSGNYEDFPDTFWGNYGCIIESIKAHAPNCHMIIATVMYHDAYTAQSGSSTTNIPVINNAIKGLAEHYSIPCIDIFDDIFYRSPDYQNNMQATAYTHPDPILFPGMANANMRLFAKAVSDNPAYFRTSTAPDPDE